MIDYKLSFTVKVLTESIQSDKYIHVLCEHFILWGGGLRRRERKVSWGRDMYLWGGGGVANDNGRRAKQQRNHNCLRNNVRDDYIISQ